MINHIARTSLLASMLMLSTVASPAGATVLAGSITRIPEGTGLFTWPPSSGQFYQQWSFANEDYGYVYGRDYVSSSNADVAVVFNMTDPTRMTNAQELTYSRGAVYFREGDTVFFRKPSTGYAAWRIDRIDQSPSSNTPRGYLYGQWYYQNNGTGNFTPEPTSLSALAGAAMVLRRRRSK